MRRARARARCSTASNSVGWERRHKAKSGPRAACLRRIPALDSALPFLAARKAALPRRLRIETAAEDRIADLPALRGSLAFDPLDLTLARRHDGLLLLLVLSVAAEIEAHALEVLAP